MPNFSDDHSKRENKMRESATTLPGLPIAVETKLMRDLYRAAGSAIGDIPDPRLREKRRVELSRAIGDLSIAFRKLNDSSHSGCHQVTITDNRVSDESR